jgi:aminopeptidase-like protein
MNQQIIQTDLLSIDVNESLFDGALMFAKNIFGFQKSVTGKGINKALEILTKDIECNIIDFPSNTKVLDWQVPLDWECDDAFIIDIQSKKTIVKFDHPLRVASHSCAVDEIISGKELKKKVRFSFDFPEALTHNYLYYKEDWLISVTKSELNLIEDDKMYHVLINSKKTEGSLKVAEASIIGHSKKTIFFLSHICHPAQFNDGLVGVMLNYYMYKYLKSKNFKPYYTYKFLFMPETIGSIAYCSDENRIKNAEFGIFNEMTALKQKLHIQQSFDKDDRVNKIISQALNHLQITAKFSPFLKVIRNDEKVFNSPGIDIPSASITRALGPGKPGHPFPGYHTSLDTIENADLNQLKEVLSLYKVIININEKDFIVKRKFKGIPMLSKHNLFIDPSVDRNMYNRLEQMVWLIKGETRISEIAKNLDLDFFKTWSILKSWNQAGLIDLSYEK